MNIPDGVLPSWNYLEYYLVKIGKLNTIHLKLEFLNFFIIIFYEKPFRDKNNNLTIQIHFSNFFGFYICEVKFQNRCKIQFCRDTSLPHHDHGFLPRYSWQRHLIDSNKVTCGWKEFDACAYSCRCTGNSATYRLKVTFYQGRIPGDAAPFMLMHVPRRRDHTRDKSRREVSNERI